MAKRFYMFVRDDDKTPGLPNDDFTAWLYQTPGYEHIAHFAFADDMRYTLQFHQKDDPATIPVPVIVSPRNHLSVVREPDPSGE